jgi:hypothetical protein
MASLPIMYLAVSYTHYHDTATNVPTDEMVRDLIS